MDYDFLSASDGSGDAALMTVESLRLSGGTTIEVDTIANVPDKFIATYGVRGSNGFITPDSKREFTGHLDSGDLVIDGFEPGSVDDGNEVGDVVVIRPTTGFANRIAKFIQDATNNGTPENVTFSTLLATAITAASATLSGSVSVGGDLSVAGGTTLTGGLTIKAWDGYVTSPDTFVYVSATSFKIAGKDVTAQFPIGTRIKLTQTDKKFFYVVGAAMVSTDTVVTITGGSDFSLANTTITLPCYAYVAAPQGFPNAFNWLPLPTGYSSVTVAFARFSMIGARVMMDFEWVGASNSSAIAMTLPVAPLQAYLGSYIRANNTTAGGITRGSITLGVNSLTAGVFRDVDPSTTWSNTGNKQVWGSGISYEAFSV